MLTFNQNISKSVNSPTRLTRNFILNAPFKNLNSVKLEENIFFSDPKVVEEKIFTNSYNPYKLLAEKEKRSLISKVAQKDSKRIKDTLTSQETSSLMNEHILFEEFMVMLRYGGKNYLDQLTEVISNKKPSVISLKATARYFSHVNAYDKLDSLLKNSPQIFGNSSN
jgi:hypothetical protein|tara:strand:+ start:308 stop:808 length:501 start_codon:yes stop_codon:yes gene_type:complete